MSSYLVAIYVGEFIPNRFDSQITIYTHKTYINQTSYIGAEAPKHLNALSDYTGIKYTLPKMDLLAVPDLSFGAMENWGINTYR
jgi:aminopeptidase N